MITLKLNLIGKKLLLVSLNKSYPKDAEGMYKRANNYERTRKYWRVSVERIKEIDYVLGIYKGEVKAVCVPVSWKQYKKVEENGHCFNNEVRYGFEGAEVLDSPYLNKDVSDYPFGSGGPVRYIP